MFKSDIDVAEPPTEAVETMPQTVEAKSPVSEAPASPTAPLSSFKVEAKAQEIFRPALEVDHFIWPDACISLLDKAQARFDRAAEALIAQTAAGRKVVAVSGCRRGEGRTTLLLALARRLAAGGLKVCLIDDDFQNPQLARRLGMAVEMGWEDVLSGKLPVTEALVESIDEGLTLLPVAKKSAGSSAPASQLRRSVTLSMLREHYDLVLVDSGPLAESGGAEANLMDDRSDIDAAILVRDVRHTSPDELVQAERRLKQSNVACIGIVENFVQ